MSLFKNKVGRPSNSTLRNRKLFLCFSIIILILLSTILILFGLNVNNIRGDVITKPVFDISGTNGGYIYNGKYYAKGKYNLTTDQIANGVVFTNSAGTTVINIRARFPESIYNIKYDPLKGKRHDYIKFVSYGDNNKVLAQSSVLKVTKASYNYSFKITSSVRYIAAEIYSANSSDTGPSSRAVQKKIRTSSSSVVNISPSNTSLKKNSNGVYTVTSFANYTSNVSISNPSGLILYYRWFTYKNLNKTKNNISFRGTCVKFNARSVKISNLGLNVSQSYPERSGKIKVYSSKSLCEKDNDSLTSTDVGSKTISYANNTKTATNKEGFIMLSNYQIGKASLNNLSKSIGQQAPGVCFDYALAYGVYVMKNGGNYKHPTSYSYPANRSAYGSDVPYSTNGSLNAKNYTDMFNKIKTNINKGIPLVLWVNNSGAGGSGTHYVTIIGYRNEKVNNSSSFMKNVWVLDPANIGGKVISVPLNKRGYTMKYYDQLRWWSSISKAKMPGIFVK